MAKTKRVKSDRNLEVILNWSQADQIVLRIGILQSDIQAEEAEATAKIEAIKANLAEKAKPLQDKVTLYSDSLQAFGIAHYNELGKNRQSRKLNHGTVGWRKSVAISVKKTTLELIKKVFGRKAAQYIHVKETPDKEALAKLTDEQLAKVGARRKHKDVFFVEPDNVEAADHG